MNTGFLLAGLALLFLGGDALIGSISDRSSSTSVLSIIGSAFALACGLAFIIYGLKKRKDVPADRGTQGGTEATTESKSIIQQRMDLDRTRTSGLVACTVGGLFLVLAVLQLFGAPEHLATALLQGIVGAIVVGAGIAQLVRHRSRVVAFDAVHGADAGVRKSIT